MKSRVLTALLAVGLFAAGTSAEIVPASEITGLSSGMFPGYTAANAYDGSGLSGTWHNGGDPNCAVQGKGRGPDGVAGNADDISRQYSAGTALGRWWLGYQFDNVEALAEIDIWNIGGSFWTAGYKDVVIETSETGSDWSVAFNGILNPGADTDPFEGPTDTIDLNGVSAQYVIITATDSHGYGTYSYAGLAEVQFVVVPEPVTLAVLALGGGLALLRRRV